MVQRGGCYLPEPDQNVKDNLFMQMRRNCEVLSNCLRDIAEVPGVSKELIAICSSNIDDLQKGIDIQETATLKISDLMKKMQEGTTDMIKKIEELKNKFTP